MKRIVMKRLFVKLLKYGRGLCLLALVPACHHGFWRVQEAAPCDPDNGGLLVPGGFCAAIVAKGVGAARHLTVSPTGRIYTILSNIRPGAEPKGIVTLVDLTGDGRADTEERFGQLVGSSIEWRGSYLYVSSRYEVARFDVATTPTFPPQKQIVLGSLPYEYGQQHPSRPFAFDDEGNMYVHVPAPSNACESVHEGETVWPDPCSELNRYAGVWRYSAERLNQTPQDGVLVASGIRSAVAIRVHAKSGALYAINHGRDGLDHRRHPNVFPAERDRDIPADELLRIDLRGRASDFGWPYCYQDPLYAERILAPEYGGDGRRQGRCESVARPAMSFPAHSAPNDILFYRGTQFPERYKEGAFVAFHGGWTAAAVPQMAYRVVFIPFRGGVPFGDWEVFAQGFAGTDDVHDPNKARYRPMGLAEGPDGSLYVSDSRAGRIWRVVSVSPTGK